ncbi:MAG: DUF2974 domain-containing protein [Bacilli bacterium]|nr:DUF2974 domain-containing protein [Bacilli bacterium]
MTVLGYLKKKQDTFKQYPTNIVDALAVSWMAYFDFSIVKDRLPLKVEDFKYIHEYQTLEPYYTAFLPRFSRRYMRALYESYRFKEAVLLEYEYVLDKAKGVQFAVIALKCEEDIIIAIRGTDPEYAGWQEDFTMSYKDTISSYVLAEAFVKRVMKKYKGNIILCGHSKGGNICTYLLSVLTNYNRIKHVYSFDGPGFRNTSLFKDKEERLEKYTKIVPKSSVVGVLFSNATDIKIVKSRSFFLLQHNPFQWVIEGDDFVYLNKRSLSSRYLERSLNAWIESLNEEERQRFTQIIFGELNKFETEDITVFFKKLFFQVKPVYKAYRKLNKEDKELVNRVIKKLIKNLIKADKPKQIAA